MRERIQNATARGYETDAYITGTRKVLATRTAMACDMSPWRQQRVSLMIAGLLCSLRIQTA